MAPYRGDFRKYPSAVALAGITSGPVLPFPSKRGSLRQTAGDAMRHSFFALCLTCLSLTGLSFTGLCLATATPALCETTAHSKAKALAEVRAKAGAEVRPAQSRASTPAEADVREYISLYGYREMMALGAQRQLESIIEIMRQSRPDLPPGVLELIQQELGDELKAESDTAVSEMVAVFQKNLTREDVAYLNSVGRDPRMKRVVALQPRIALDMEGIGERLAEAVTAKAGPRIEQRLRLLRGGREL